MNVHFVIAESKPEENKHQYLGALMWTRRLGNAAKLGIQVIMRQLINFKAVPVSAILLIQINEIVFKFKILTANL